MLVIGVLRLDYIHDGGRCGGAVVVRAFEDGVDGLVGGVRCVGVEEGFNGCEACGGGGVVKTDEGK